MGETVARAPDQLLYIRAILGIVESARATIDELATEVLGALEESFTSRFGPNYLPRPEETTEFSQILQDFRDLGGTVVAYRLDKALQQQIVTGISEITAQMLLRGQLEPKASVGRPRDTCVLQTTRRTSSAKRRFQCVAAA